MRTGIGKSRGIDPRGRVLKWIEESIAGGELRRGAAAPSSRELAAELGVARGTAAAALEEAERRGILLRRDPAAKKRYVPEVAANGAVAGSTIYVLGDLGLAFDGSQAPRWTDRYLSLEAVSRLSATGRHVMMLNADALSSAAVDDLFRAPPAAMLILATVSGNPAAMRALEKCRAAGVPVAVHGNAPELRAFDRVYTDHRATGRALTEWILARGRRRIVPLFPYMPQTFWARERLAGYEEAMKEAGLAPQPCKIFGTDLPDDLPPPECFRIRKGLATTALLELFHGNPKKPFNFSTVQPFNSNAVHDAGGVDALFCLTDNWARVANAAMRDLGIAPHGKILTTGHDNIAPGAEFGEFESEGPDATIDKHNETKAEAMAALLAARLAGELPNGPQCRAHPFALVERKAASDRN